MQADSVWGWSEMLQRILFYNFRTLEIYCVAVLEVRMWLQMQSKWMKVVTRRFGNLLVADAAISSSELVSICQNDVHGTKSTI